MSSDLSAAVRSVEAFLLYPHSRYTAPPTPPTELPSCPLYEGARKAAIAVVEAKWELAFQEPVIAELLQNWEDIEALERSLREAAAGKGPEGELSVLVAAVACLQCFVQANWTGPEVTGEAIPMFPNQRALESARNSYIMSRLEVDGEPLYDVTRGPQLLLTSVTVLCGDMLQQSSLESVGVWRARAAFVWQRMLAEATARGDGQSVTCMQASVQEYAEALRKGGYITEDLCRQVTACGPSAAPSALREAEDDRAIEKEATVKLMPCEAVPNTVRSVLVLELAIHTSYYGLPTDVSDDIIDVAAKHVGFSWEITGVEGIKRRYQTQAFAQLTCVTKSSLPAPMVEAAAAGESTGEDEGARQNVQMAELDPDTDVLESVQYTSDEFKPTVLHAVEQAILLTKAVRLLLSSAADDDDAITMEQIGCLVNRALVLPEKFNDPRDAGCSAHWLVYSAGLWLRCRTEFGRVKTRNRAAFQLQALVDQYKDKLPEDEGGAALVADRIGYVHSVYYPSLPMLQREFGKRMMEMGMVLSAYDMFVSINMWCEAIDCLIVADRKRQAEKLVKERLEASDTPTSTRPRLLCQLGDITGEKRWWQQAWEESDHRYARAVRSLGRGALQSGDRYEAIKCFKQSLEISPLKAGIWFSLGAMYLQVSQYQDAATAFTRALGVDDTDAQSWANLAAAYITMAQEKMNPDESSDSAQDTTHDVERYLKFANTCSYEAVKRSRESWRMWQNLLTVAQMRRDPAGMTYAARGLAVELGRVETILDDDALLKDLVSLSVSTGKRRPAIELFETLSKLHGTNPVCHRCLAELADNDEEVAKQRVLQLRHLLPKIHDAKDLTSLKFELTELRDCMGVLVEECKKGLGNKGGLSMLVRSAVRKVNVKLQENGLSSKAEWTGLQHEIEGSSQEIVDLVKAKNKIVE